MSLVRGMLQNEPVETYIGGPQDGGDSQGASEGRNRVKARKFRSIFDDLPEEIRAAVLEARADKSGKARSKESAIINEVIKSVEGKLTVCTSGPKIKEVLSKGTRKFKTDAAHGIPREAIFISIC
eukprot:15457910-Alexandrium_andersonii.AAC.1